MKIKKTGILAAAVVLAVAAAGWLVLHWNGPQTAYTKNIFAMDTYFTLKAYGPEAEDALAAAEQKVRELEELFSVTAEGSDIYRINTAIETAVSADTISLIITALQLCEETDGALDLTIYPVLRAWGFTTGTFQVPEAEDIERLLEKVDHRQIACDSEKAVVRTPEGAQLDLGAVAKGYTGDCLIGILRAAGVKSAILDLGGNVQTLGTKPDGSSWQVAVKNPFDPGEELGVLQVADKAVITSGNYERYFVSDDGKRYGHILNPADGYPADKGLMAVTVVGERGVVCDGFSTALFVMGPERAIDFWRQRRDFEMLLVTDEGKLYLTEGLTDCFRSSEGWNAEIITAEK